MNPEKRLRDVERIVQAALACEPSTRSAFVDHARK
jgi:hypothetical protein